MRISVLIIFALAADAAADDGETIIVIDHAARDRDRALGDAPFVSVLHPDDHPATASVADAVATAAGVHEQSLGGLGAYASISVRGAAPGHTAVLIDGVPLARIAAVTTDLGRFALASFGEVDLYRGAVPVELGGAGVGGALDLVTRLGRGEHGEVVSASLGAGSFGARHARLHAGESFGALDTSATVGYQGATGDYTYYDDNGTPLNRSDDMYRVRKNNGFDQVDAALRAATHDRDRVGGVRVAYRQQGLPGATAVPALVASLATLDAIGDGSFDAHVGDAIAHQLGYVLVERQHLEDPDGELGLGAADRMFVTIAGGGSTTWKLPLGPHRGAFGLELRGERFRDRDTTGVQPALVGDRLGGAVTGAVDLLLAPALVVTPAMRLDVLRTAPTPMTAGPDALAREPARVDVVPSPRLTARFLATPDVSIKGSTGLYTRLPTLVEVFGDRGFIVGTPGLRPERGPSSDLGVVWAPAQNLGDFDRILVEADAFATRAHDTIAFITYAGFVARAANLGDTQTYGGELVASGRYARMLSLTASYTRIVSEQLSADPSIDGKPIPRTPAHMLYTRADLEHRRGGAWLDASWQSESFLDPASLGRVPGRVLLGCGVRVALPGHAAVALSVQNLADERVVHLPLVPPPNPNLTEAPTALTDVAGFPLPGRSFYLSVDWNH